MSNRAWLVGEFFCFLGILFDRTDKSALSHSVFLSVLPQKNNRSATAIHKTNARHNAAFAIISLHLKTDWDFWGTCRPNLYKNLPKDGILCTLVPSFLATTPTCEFLGFTETS